MIKSNQSYALVGMIGVSFLFFAIVFAYVDSSNVGVESIEETIPSEIVPLDEKQICSIADPRPGDDLYSLDNCKPAEGFSTESSVQRGVLVNFAFDLINKDRTENGLDELVMGINSAAQEHADNIIETCNAKSHYGSNGMKPYMRYTLSEGNGFVQETVKGFALPPDMISIGYSIHWDEETVNKVLTHMHYQIINDDEDNFLFNTNNTLNPHNNKVNIGIAWNENCFTYVQNFEADHIDWNVYPSFDSDQILTLSGIINVEDFDITDVQVDYEKLPKDLSSRDKKHRNEEYYYGKLVGCMLPPPGSHGECGNVKSLSWNVNSDGKTTTFDIQADFSRVIEINDEGVYTVFISGEQSDGTRMHLTTFSIFLR